MYVALKTISPKCNIIISKNELDMSIIMLNYSKEFWIVLL